MLLSECNKKQIAFVHFLCEDKNDLNVKWEPCLHEILILSSVDGFLFFVIQNFTPLAFFLSFSFSFLFYFFLQSLFISLVSFYSFTLPLFISNSLCVSFLILNLSLSQFILISNLRSLSLSVPLCLSTSVSLLCSLPFYF